MMQETTHIAQISILYVFSCIFRILPLDRASALGGWLGNLIGPLLSVNKTADENIRQAFPELSATERKSIITGMWDNLGRVVAEYPHLPSRKMSERIQADIKSTEILRNANTDYDGAIFISAHLGNWELAAKTGHDHDLSLTTIYRPPNNPYVDKYIRSIRMNFCKAMYPKGFHGAAQAIKALRSGGNLAMLVDQKMNDGIAVPFFGRDAMTAPAVAELALKYNKPIIPVRIIRNGRSAHFRFEALPPLKLPNTGDKQADILTTMITINALLETWVSEHPEQWFWVHNRWKR